MPPVRTRPRLRRLPRSTETRRGDRCRRGAGAAASTQHPRSRGRNVRDISDRRRVSGTKGMGILILERDPSLNQLLANVMEAAGHAFDVADNVEALLEISDRCDVVVLNLHGYARDDVIALPGQASLLGAEVVLIADYIYAEAAIECGGF